MKSEEVIVVTGGSGGIGGAIAKRFGRAGARVALLDVRLDAVAARASELASSGIDAIGLECDVADPAVCQSSIESVVDRFGRVDILVNCAGLTQIGPFAETDLAVYRRVMGVNFFGAIYCTKAALPWLKKSRGLIVAISSVAGFAPLLGRTGYCASKHALHGFFDTLRCELAEDGVGVMISCPTFVDTEFARSGLGPDGQTLKTERSTSGEIVTPESIADSIFRGASRRRDLLVHSRTGKIAYWTSRLAPRFYARTMTRRFKSAIES